MINNKFEFFKTKADQKKNIKLINDLKPAEIYADRDMVSIVAQNLISNMHEDGTHFTDELLAKKKIKRITAKENTEA